MTKGCNCACAVSPMFSTIEEVCSWMIIIIVIIWMVFYYGTFQMGNLEMVRYSPKHGTSLEGCNSNEDISVIDISGVYSGNDVKRAIWYQGSRGILWEENESKNRTDVVGMRTTKQIQGKGLNEEECLEEGVQELSIVESSEKMSRECEGNVRIKKMEDICQWKPIWGAGLIANGNTSEPISRNISNEEVTDFKKISTISGISPNVSSRVEDHDTKGTDKLQASSSVKADGKGKQIVRKKSVSGMRNTDVRPRNTKRDGTGNGSSKRMNNRKIEENKEEERSRTLNRHGSKDVKYGANTWFYNKRIERRIRQERLRKREEMIEDWIHNSNVELNVDDILVSMINENTSWSLKNDRPRPCSQRGTGRETNRTVQVRNRRRS